MLDFRGFVLGVYEYMTVHKEVCRDIRVRRETFSASPSVYIPELEEEEDMPEDLADLTPEEQQRRIKVRAAYMMGLGTLLCILFADPMVGVLDEIGKRLVSALLDYKSSCACY